MREILFRGKSVITGEWIEGDLIDWRVVFSGEDYSGRIFIANSVHGKIELQEIDSKTLGQYSGIKDRNGKRIFEGDIVKYFYDGDEYGQGVIDFGLSGYPGFEMYPTVCDECNSLHFYSENGELEVVGNIL